MCKFVQNVLKCKKTKDRCKMKKQKKDPLYKSFGYAFAGIFAVVTKERNMKIHCVAMVCVVIAGFVFHITPVEWCICLTLFGLVMALEMVNTAVEAVVDLVTEERKPLAKLAKMRRPEQY